LTIGSFFDRSPFQNRIQPQHVERRGRVIPFIEDDLDCSGARFVIAVECMDEAG
jgi:hypothetical protein